jgi:hypothetical protein
MAQTVIYSAEYFCVLNATSQLSPVKSDHHVLFNVHIEVLLKQIINLQGFRQPHCTTPYQPQWT